MNAALQHILSKKSILEFLDKRGIKPSKKLSGGRYCYMCPIHKDHKTPSFILWTSAEYENWYCFGCGSGYTIVHLLSYLDNISFAESVSRLSEGLDVTVQENLDFILRDLDRFLENYYNKDFDFSKNLISISHLCYLYLKGVNFDESECGIIDKFFEELDMEISLFDWDEISSTLYHLPDILRTRREAYDIEQKRKEEEIIRKSLADTMSDKIF